MTFDVVVVGSINWDVTVLAPRHPLPGETVMGISHYSGPGGKGANQAVAAARLGARVAMIGRVGDDEPGSVLRDRLEAEGIDTTAVSIDREAATGLAVIVVDANAENSIVVSPGANANLLADHLDLDLLAKAKVVLAQLEVPVETIEAATNATQGRFCLNPAPARQIPKSLLGGVSVIIPNRGELAALASLPELVDIEEVESAARSLAGTGTVVVTLGADGALVVQPGETTHLVAPQVDAVDTTAAGDAFCGALASSLAEDGSVIEACRRAMVAGALAATRPGAQSSLPSKAEVEARL